MTTAETFQHEQASATTVTYLLAPYEHLNINDAYPLLDRQQTYDKHGLNGLVIAGIAAGAQNFYLVDRRDTEGTRDFLIIDDTCDIPAGQGFKGLMPGEVVRIGRDHQINRFDYAQTVSRNHFEVVYLNGAVTIRNLNPTNKTAIEVKEPNRAQDLQIPDGRTVMSVNRVARGPYYIPAQSAAPYGYYHGYHVLGRLSTRIDGGVYLGGSAREGIVVDGNSVAMQTVYDRTVDIIESSASDDKTFSTNSILTAIKNTVRSVMPYSEYIADDMAWRHRGDQLADLSLYVKRGGGVCRQQNLLAAFLIEKFIQDTGFLRGVASIERNELPAGAHAWAVHKSTPGEPRTYTVIDATQNYIGTKAGALQNGRWDYTVVSDDYR